jgi:hypothetical protein
MQHANLGAVEFVDGLSYQFPATECCNCSAGGAIVVLPQRTRRSTYLLIAGTELTFEFALPFCERCRPTARRHPKNLAHRALEFFLVFGLMFCALLMQAALDEAFALRNLVVETSLAAAGLWTVLRLAIQRVKPPMTSYFQPVRIKRLKRDFLSGTIKRIDFDFSNARYKNLFRSLNSANIRSGYLGV